VRDRLATVAAERHKNKQCVKLNSPAFLGVDLVFLKLRGRLGVGVVAVNFERFHVRVVCRSREAADARRTCDDTPQGGSSSQHD